MQQTLKQLLPFYIQLSGEQKRCLSFPILLLKNRFGLNSVFNFAQLQMEINQYIDSVILFILIEFLVDDTTSFIWNAWTCCLTFFSFFIQKVMIVTKSATTPNKCRKISQHSLSLYIRQLNITIYKATIFETWQSDERRTYCRHRRTATEMEKKESGNETLTSHTSHQNAENNNEKWKH